MVVRVKKFTTLSFERHEREVLKRANLAIRIAFPDDDRDEHGKYRARNLLEAARGQKLEPEALRDAHSCMWKLTKQLQRESSRTYWEEQLTPQDDVQSISGVPLIAPGTDIVGMLTETRGTMLQDCNEALHLLGQAVCATDSTC